MELYEEVIDADRLMLWGNNVMDILESLQKNTNFDSLVEVLEYSAVS